MLILVFSIRLDWFPDIGMEDVVAFHEGWARVVDIAHHLVLPTITLSLFYLALYTRLMRATVLEQRGAEYATTARAKGLTERAITVRHVLRNALLPVITMAGFRSAPCWAVLSSWKPFLPGRALGSSRTSRCSRAISTCSSGSSFCPPALVVVVNIIVDVIYVLLDPRIRVGGKT